MLVRQDNEASTAGVRAPVADEGPAAVIGGRINGEQQNLFRERGGGEAKKAAHDKSLAIIEGGREVVAAWRDLEAMVEKHPAVESSDIERAGDQGDIVKEDSGALVGTTSRDCAPSESNGTVAKGSGGVTNAAGGGELALRKTRGVRRDGGEKVVRLEGG